MKNVTYIILACCGFLWASCTSDDTSNDCTQEDWVGTYIGARSCDDTNESIQDTLVISAAPQFGEDQYQVDKIPIAIEIIGCTTTEINFTPISDEDLGSTTYTLAGNTITIESTTKSPDKTCIFIGSK